MMNLTGVYSYMVLECKELRARVIISDQHTMLAIENPVMSKMRHYDVTVSPVQLGGWWNLPQYRSEV